MRERLIRLRKEHVDVLVEALGLATIKDLADELEQHRGHPLEECSSVEIAMKQLQLLQNRTESANLFSDIQAAFQDAEFVDVTLPDYLVDELKKVLSADYSKMDLAVQAKIVQEGREAVLKALDAAKPWRQSRRVQADSAQLPLFQFHWNKPQR